MASMIISFERTFCHKAVCLACIEFVRPHLYLHIIYWFLPCCRSKLYMSCCGVTREAAVCEWYLGLHPTLWVTNWYSLNQGYHFVINAWQICVCQHVNQRRSENGRMWNRESRVRHKLRQTYIWKVHSLCDPIRQWSYTCSRSSTYRTCTWCCAASSLVRRLHWSDNLFSLNSTPLTTHTFRHHLEQQTWSWVSRSIQLCFQRLVVYFSKTLVFNLDSKRCTLSGTLVWTWWHHASAYTHNYTLGRLIKCENEKSMLHRAWQHVDDHIIHNYVYIIMSTALRWLDDGALLQIPL